MKSVKKQFIFYRLSHIYRDGLKFWCWCAILAALPLFLAHLFDTEGKYCLIFNIIGTALILTGLAGFLILSIRRYEKRHATARRFDETTGSFNRFETYLELEKSSHPLKENHTADTRIFFREYRLPWGTFLFLLSLATALLFTGADAAMMSHAQQQNKQYREHKEENQKAEEKKKQEEEQRKKLAAETAKLIITTPESELRAKPLDELDWEGAGESPHGFTELALSVYVNAEFHSNIPPEALPAGDGRIRFGAFLALEDFEVKPFDLISYHLTGKALVGGEQRTILSEPGFIEVRPFREDVLTGKEDGDNGAKLTAEGLQAIEILNAFLSEQLRLNKALFALKIYKLNPDENNPVDTGKALDNITAMQQELSGNLDKYLQDPKSRTLPADIVNYLELARQDMNNCVGSLAGQDIDQGSKHQQKAIANLIQAMKNIRKLMIKGPPGVPEIKDSPFKDKQKFKSPEIDASQNPHNQLKQLAGEQKNLNNDIKKAEQSGAGGPQNETADKQDRIQERTEQLKAKSLNGSDFQEKLDQAMESMSESSNNLRAGKNAAASLKGQKAAANLESAVKLLEKESDEATRKALDEARQKMDELSNELKSGQKDAEQVRDELSSMPGELGEKAGQQGNSGMMGNAGKLGRLAERIDQSAGGKPGPGSSPAQQAKQMQKELQEIKDMINEMRMNGMDAAQFLESAAGKLNEQSRHLKYAAKNPEEIDPAEADAVMNDMKELLEDMDRALSMLGEQTSDPALRQRLETIRGKVRITGGSASSAMPKGRPTACKEVSDNAAHVVSLLSELLVDLKRQVRVYVFDAGDVPVKYRKATAEYFERLSNPDPKGGK